MTRLILSIAFFLACAAAAIAGGVDIRKGDHVVFLGNTFAEKMQHHWFFEALPRAHCANHGVASGTWVGARTKSP